MTIEVKPLDPTSSLSSPLVKSVMVELDNPSIIKVSLPAPPVAVSSTPTQAFKYIVSSVAGSVSVEVAVEPALFSSSVEVAVEPALFSSYVEVAVEPALFSSSNALKDRANKASLSLFKLGLLDLIAAIKSYFYN